MGNVSIINPYLQGIPYTAPTFVAAGTVDSSGISVNPGLPTGHTTDDILIAFVFANRVGGSPTINTPAGWTVIQSQTGGLSPFWRLSVYYKRDGGAESTPAFGGTFDGSVARMLAFRGCKASGSPVDTSAKNSSAAGTSLTFPAITSTIKNTMVVNVVGGPGPDAVGTTEFSAWANATLDSITEATDNTSSNDTGQSLGSAYGVLAGITSSGQSTATSVTSSEHGYVTLNLIGLPT